MIILDTNVVSELLRPAPAPQVEAWLSAQDGANVYLTTVVEINRERLTTMDKRALSVCYGKTGIFGEGWTAKNNVLGGETGIRTPDRL